MTMEDEKGRRRCRLCFTTAQVMTPWILSSRIGPFGVGNAFSTLHFSFFPLYGSQFVLFFQMLECGCLLWVFVFCFCFLCFLLVGVVLCLYHSLLQFVFRHVTTYVIRLASLTFRCGLGFFEFYKNRIFLQIIFYLLAFRYK